MLQKNKLVKKIRKIRCILVTVKKKKHNKLIKSPKSKFLAQGLKARGWQTHGTATSTGHAWCNKPYWISRTCSVFSLALKVDWLQAAFTLSARLMINLN